MKLIDKFKKLLHEQKREKVQFMIDAIYQEELSYIKSLSPEDRQEYLIELCNDVNDYPNILQEIKDSSKDILTTQAMVDSNFGGAPIFDIEKIDRMAVGSAIIGTTISILSYLISYKLADKDFTIMSNLQALSTSAIASLFTFGTALVGRASKILPNAKLAIKSHINNKEAEGEYVHNQAYKAILNKYGVDPAKHQNDDEMSR